LAWTLTECPYKGSLGETIPTDPLIYRFYEIMQVYGMPVKAAIHEKFGDGIMSAIDFDLKVQKEEDPQRRSGEYRHVWKVLTIQKVVG